MIVKVCGMRQPDNIDAVAATGIDMMGFIFYRKSPRFVDQLDGSTINALKNKGIEPVALFVDEDIDVVVATLQRYGFTTVQLHGSEGVDYCDRLRAHGYKVLKAISISDEGDVARAALYDGHADLLVVDTKCNGKGGSGMKFDWRLLENATFATPFLLSGGIAATDAEAVAALYRSSAPRMAGVDINSRFETAPALKSPAIISQFLSQLSQLIK